MIWVKFFQTNNKAKAQLYERDLLKSQVVPEIEEI